MMKIGVFGGCFNPVHKGHLKIAQWTRRALKLDRVLFIPVGKPSHRPPEEMEDFSHRLALVRLALRGKKWAQACDLEGRRGGINYTIDTLRELRIIYPPPHELFLLIGGDSLASLPTWKDFPRLFEYSRIICYPRGTIRPKIPSLLRNALPPEELEQLRSGCLPAPLLGTSSTAIRMAIRKERPVNAWLPPAVADYIKRHRLYQPQENPPGKHLTLPANG